MRTQTYTHYGDPTGITYGVQMLLVANIAAYIIDWLIFPLKPFFELHANWWSHFGVWELISYQFLHQGPMHLISNMLGLYFLGPDVERGLGTNRFFTLYFLSGILGGLGWALLAPTWHSCVGASGAVFGVLGAYAALYPNRELILIIFPFKPVKAWVLVLFFGAYELLHTIDGPGGAVANAAHLGGGIAGYIYALTIGRPDLRRKLKQKLDKRPAPVTQYEIDRILDKAAKHGLNSLTKNEREKLKNANKR
jgi:membrane associated rhomboid family serine protease